MGSSFFYFSSMKELENDIKQQRLYDGRTGQASGKVIIQEKDWETGIWFTVKTL